MPGRSVAWGRQHRQLPLEFLPHREIAVPISVTGPQCQYTVKVKDESAGNRGKCPQCKSTVQIPQIEESVILEMAEPVNAPALRHVLGCCTLLNVHKSFSELGK